MREDQYPAGSVRLETYDDGLAHWHVVGSGCNALCYDEFNLRRRRALTFLDFVPTCLRCFVLAMNFTFEPYP